MARLKSGSYCKATTFNHLECKVEPFQLLHYLNSFCFPKRKVCYKLEKCNYGPKPLVDHIRSFSEMLNFANNCKYELRLPTGTIWVPYDCLKLCFEKNRSSMLVSTLFGEWRFHSSCWIIINCYVTLQFCSDFGGKI